MATPLRLWELGASKSGRTIYFNGKALKRAHLPSANHLDMATREAYWVSGIKKDGLDRHWAGSGKVAVEAGVVAEHLRVTGSPELDLTRFEVSEDLKPTDPSTFFDQENTVLDREAGRRRRRAPAQI